MTENHMAKDQDQLSEKELDIVAGGSDDSDVSTIVSDIFSDAPEPQTPESEPPPPEDDGIEDLLDQFPEPPPAEEPPGEPLPDDELAEMPAEEPPSPDLELPIQVPEDDDSDLDLPIQLP